MGLTLSIETSSKVCSAAIHERGVLLATSEVHIEHSHASRLAILIDEVKRSAGIELKELEAVGVTSGPGSYTGLRIGTSTAKGICFALNIPLVVCGTLELMAHQTVQKILSTELLCPMLDARRMEVYCALFDAQIKSISPVEAKIIDESSFNDILQSNTVIFFGDGSDKCKEKITHPNARFISGIYPAAQHMGSLIYSRFEAGKVEDVMAFEPHYLKEFMIKKAVAS